jgi:hypothetical protein
MPTAPINPACDYGELRGLWPLIPTRSSDARPIYLKNKAKIFFQKPAYRRPYRRKATAYENIGLFRLISLKKTSPSIASDDDRTI